jgi:hypothetical protein
MTGVWILALALLIVMAGCELALGGTKLQTGLTRALAVWAVVYLLALFPLFRYGGTGPFPFTIFWGGAFLSWFGVRSHIESSILLRMLYLLRRGPMTEAALVAAYASNFGEGTRREELLRGGLAVKEGDRLSITPKGRTILSVVAKLR